MSNTEHTLQIQSGSHLHASTSFVNVFLGVTRRGIIPESQVSKIFANYSKYSAVIFFLCSHSLEPAAF